MAIADLIPEMDDKGLTNLRGNAERLAKSGTPRQRADADRLLPLIVTEIESRKAATAAKPKAPRKVAAAPRKPAAPRRAPAKAAKAAASAG